MAFLVKALFQWNECSKNDDISVLSNFQQFFQIFLSISRNFTKFYLHAKIQFNWAIQTEITGGRGQNLPPPSTPYQPAISPACLGLIMLRWKENYRRLRLFKYLKNTSILSLYARNVRNLYHFWLSEKISDSYNVNKLFIIIKHVIWRFRIYNIHIFFS